MQITIKILRIVIFIVTVPNKFTSRTRLLGSTNYIDKRMIAYCTVVDTAGTIFSISEVQARSIKLDACSVIRVGSCTSWFNWYKLKSWLRLLAWGVSLFPFMSTFRSPTNVARALSDEIVSSTFSRFVLKSSKSMLGGRQIEPIRVLLLPGNRNSSQLPRVRLS